MSLRPCIGNGTCLVQCDNECNCTETCKCYLNLDFENKKDGTCSSCDKITLIFKQKCGHHSFCVECITFLDESECEIRSSTCRGCDHNKNHTIFFNEDHYCREECPHKCEPMKCKNYRYCSAKLPQWVLNCQESMCIDCATEVGPLEFLDEKRECPVCFDVKEIIKVVCGHTFCLDCWIHWSRVSEDITTCPLCRKKIFLPS